MNTKDVKKIKSRSYLSVGSLFLNSSYSAVLGFTAFFILTLKSNIYLLGIYNTVLAMMAFFNYFTNLGLAAAIVQKKDIEEKDLDTAFFIQFALSIIAVILGFMFTDSLFKVYKDLPHDAVYLYWAILFSFFLLSLKTVPSVLLEKKIKIYRVVLVQAVENTVFYLSVIILSLMGMEMLSLIVAVLLRSIIGVILIYSFNPWFPKFRFSISSAKSLLKFGLMFQSNSFLALIKDDMLILYLGSVIGMTNLGYVSFAKKYGEFTLKMIMDSVNRVAFPVYSRFQSNSEMLKKSVEKVLFYNSILIFPLIFGSIFIFDSLLKLVPGYYEKWRISLFSFYFFSLSSFFITLSTPFINLFNALGKLKLSVAFMVFWTCLTWILIPIFVKFMNYNGIGVSFFLLSLTSVMVYFKGKKMINFSEANTIKYPIIACLFMVIYLSIIRYLFVALYTNLYLHVIASIIGAGIIYFLVLYKTIGKDFYMNLINFFKKND